MYPLTYRAENQRAQATNLQMGEILADTLSRMQNVANLRINLRGAGQKLQVAMNALGQIKNAFHERPPDAEGRARVIGQLSGPWNVR